MGPLMSKGGVLKYTLATTNVVFHGNSLIAGTGTTVSGAMPYQVQRLPGINNKFTVVNLGINGQNLVQMLTTGTNSVDPLFDPTKKNVLVVWEGHNTMNSLSYTGAQAYEALKTYTNARLSLNPWLIVHMTLMPARYLNTSDATANSLNTRFNDYNDLLRAGYKEMGAKLLVDVRQAGSPFMTPPDYSIESFNDITTSNQTVWSLVDNRQWVHLNNVGYAVIAQMVAATLRRMPNR